MLMAGPTHSDGRRARKKQAARDAIAATARQMFAARGFDNVTVAEVAAAADVSEKTVFNHFPTKADLAFAGRETGLMRLVTDITDRPPGTPVIDVFRSLTTTVIDDLVANGNEDLLMVAKILRDSPTLQERLTVGWESGAAAITTAVAATAGPSHPEPGQDLLPGLIARTLWFTHRSIFLAALHGLLADEDRDELVRRLRMASTRAYDQLAEGLCEYGRKP
jgi:AcrR family transcriptional regulator